MEIASCSVCYIQRKLVRVDWRRVIPVEVQPIMAVLACRRCFPEGDEEAIVPICYACRTAFD